MLSKFAVKNYKNFLEYTELNINMSYTQEDNNIKSSIILGDCGSGKSNLLHSIALIKLISETKDINLYPINKNPIELYYQFKFDSDIIDYKLNVSYLGKVLCDTLIINNKKIKKGDTIYNSKNNCTYTDLVNKLLSYINKIEYLPLGEFYFKQIDYKTISETFINNDFIININQQSLLIIDNIDTLPKVDIIKIFKQCEIKNIQLIASVRKPEIIKYKLIDNYGYFNIVNNNVNRLVNRCNKYLYCNADIEKLYNVKFFKNMP